MRGTSIAAGPAL